MGCAAFAVLLTALAWPPATDLDRFPPRAEVLAAWKFNRAYRVHLEAARGLDPRRYWAYADAFAETDALFAAWDCLDDCQRAANAWERRRQLARLRTLLGPDLYERGALPPPAPFGRFNIRD